MKILDATCGFKGIWYQKNHPFVTFMDKRKGFASSTLHTKIKNKRRYTINPDVVSDWVHAPFPNNYFDMIVFDSPHFVIDKNKKDSNITKYYGRLNKSSYKKEISEGVNKLFKILKPEGVFIFKWCENTVDIDEVLKLFPYKPLFGSNTKSKGKTANYWILFIKHNMNRRLKT